MLQSTMATLSLRSSRLNNYERIQLELSAHHGHWALSHGMYTTHLLHCVDGSLIIAAVQRSKGVLDQVLHILILGADSILLFSILHRFLESEGKGFMHFIKFLGQLTFSLSKRFKISNDSLRGIGERGIVSEFLKRFICVSPCGAGRLILQTQ